MNSLAISDCFSPDFIRDRICETSESDSFACALNAPCVLVRPTRIACNVFSANVTYSRFDRWLFFLLPSMWLTTEFSNLGPMNAEATSACMYSTCPTFLLQRFTTKYPFFPSVGDFSLRLIACLMRPFPVTSYCSLGIGSLVHSVMSNPFFDSIIQGANRMNQYDTKLAAAYAAAAKVGV